MLTLSRRLPEQLQQQLQNWLSRWGAAREKPDPALPEDVQPGALDSVPAKVQGMFPADDGTSLYYEVRGEGRPIVLCYGLTCRREHWHHQVTELAKRYSVITFDYRGHHRSAVPLNDRNLSLDWLSRDVRAVMDYLGIESAVLFGHSMGVPIVANLAVQCPERVKGVVFICGAVSNPFEHMFFSDRMSYAYRASAWLFEHAPGPFAVAWKQLTAHNAFSHFITSRLGFNATVSEERDVRMYLEGVNATPLKVFHTLLDDYVRTDGRAILEQVGCPALIVAGEDDCITPMQVQKEMAEKMQHSELVTIPGGSHNAHMDYPAQVNRRIDAFLERIKYR